MTVVADGRVAAYWAHQVGSFAAGVDRVRAGDLSAVHATRVAIRRMRSTLRTFSPLFDARPVERLDHDLEWIAGELGEVRDREVLLDLFAARGDLDPSLRAHLLDTLTREMSEQGVRVGEALDTERVRALVERLAATLDEPSTLPQADLEPYRAAARRILAKRLCRAGTDDEPERMHSARKAAKRVRYAAEVVGDLEEVRRGERLQDGLGHCQDLVVARDYLLTAADRGVVPSRTALQLARTLADERLVALVQVDRSSCLCEESGAVAQVAQPA